jgi:histidyl-tRNA synthetase
MANKTKFQAIKGTRDLLPPETGLWNRAEQTAREVFGTFGFGEIRLPIFEPTELFARAVGGETDIVSKEMYTFEDPPTIGFLMDDGSLDFVNAQNSPVLMEKLLVELTADIEAGVISKTDENQSAISTIRSVSKELFAIPEPSEEGPEDEAMERLFAYFNQRKPFEQKLRAAWFQLHKKDVISLRPEATASVCRAYIEHGMHALAQPVKLYCMGPMFRRERPQKGRYRQFYQIDVEVLEAITPNQDASKTIGKDAAVDAEVIEMVMAYFARLGLEGVQLDINSIGHSAPPAGGKLECRRGYVEKLKAALEKVKGQLGEDSRRRIETNPLRVLDSKLEGEQAIIEKLPRIGDHLCADCAKHYAEVKRQLELRGVAYRENWRLVRGLDYYMRTTFEITARGLGSQNAVCGGGRYDGLVELLGGPPTKGIGFAIGEDRVILSLLETGHSPLATRHSPLLYIAWMGERTLATAIRAARDLRQAGFRVELPPVEQKFSKALGQADKLGARYALILGEDEVASGQWTLKTLADGTQEKYSEAGLVEFLRKTRTVSS